MTHTRSILGSALLQLVQLIEQSGLACVQRMTHLRRLLAKPSSGKQTREVQVQAHLHQEPAVRGQQ